ncbi:MAG: hypothetical protein A2744_03570 [Candidatus Buchananbacteria bacterium RIFCSPHIGHO2_01_FULL_44_11]|uniref:Uncharacterized protein n=1 Tax=Candidatus Buchananbacteria bacterium RIFCSPHIGHO2_01_FULL_44_11 TaxID=1797535 RepID=A0A1G1Y2D7_9BACT|nr:MAG: hypothetical protein A2744_03570 [Candidatus Buchananbacteria bacterium RIFCSPHIGHO2_01_FULL_44_11]
MNNKLYTFNHENLEKNIADIADIGLKSLNMRRKFLISVYTTSTVQAVGIITLVVQKFITTVSNFALVGLAMISINFVAIPLYFWYISSLELSQLKRKYYFFYKVQQGEQLDGTEANDYKKITKKEPKASDPIFHLINFLYVSGSILVLFFLFRLI